MGLDLYLSRIDTTAHARWSYGGFMAFRERLASDVGIPLREMRGFTEGGRSWGKFLGEPLVPLLNHSDCEGALDYDDCETVAPRLREIVSRWPEDDYDRRRAETLAAMMDEVVEGDALAVVFC